MVKNLTHIDPKGVAHMVDVSGKEVTRRQAVAEARVIMQLATLVAIEENRIAKGDVLACARLAGVMAAKKTAELIPLCHPLFLTKISLDFQIDRTLPGIHVRSTVAVEGKTGVEMEALTAVSIACLTLYDMAKAIDKDMCITNVHLVEKMGGKSGDWKKTHGSYGC